MRALYTIAIFLYSLAIRAAAPFSVKARQMVHGWSNTWKLLPPPSGTVKTLWFHASSMGEFEQARPIIETIRQQLHDTKIVVTFFSPSGYEFRKNYPHADTVCYLPIDTPRNARRFVKKVKPDIAFFAKYDFWFNYLNALRQNNIPTYLFSAIFRPSQYFFKPYGRWFRTQLGLCFTHLFVQNQTSLQLLLQHGIPQCSIAGDTRFDRVHTIAQEARQFDIVEQFAKNVAPRKILIAGSSWQPDETMLHRYSLHNPDVAFILAPHVISESHLNTIENLWDTNQCIRYSALKSNPAAISPNHKVLIIDNIGMLSSLYRYAHTAYIGGGWGKGIHNTLEPLAFDKPVVFGPNYKKFQEAHDIISRHCGASYKTYEQLQFLLDSYLCDDSNYNKACAACHSYMAENIGSTSKILKKIFQTQD